MRRTAVGHPDFSHPSIHDSQPSCQVARRQARSREQEEAFLRGVNASIEESTSNPWSRVCDLVDLKGPVPPASVARSSRLGNTGGSSGGVGGASSSRRGSGRDAGLNEEDAFRVTEKMRSLIIQVCLFFWSCVDSVLSAAEPLKKQQNVTEGCVVVVYVASSESSVVRQVKIHLELHLAHVPLVRTTIYVPCTFLLCGKSLFHRYHSCERSILLRTLIPEMVAAKTRPIFNHFSASINGPWRSALASCLNVSMCSC